MKVAAAQISCAPGDRDANLRKVREFSERAKKSGTALIVFPEMTDTGYSMPAIQKHAATWKEGAVPQLQEIAKDLSLTIVCGVSEREGERIYNAQVIVDPNGDILAKYRKTHLVTAAPLDERPVFTAGDKFVSCKIDPPRNGSAAADNFNAGLAICYDLRFPKSAANSRWTMAQICSSYRPPGHGCASNICAFSRFRARSKTRAI